MNHSELQAAHENSILQLLEEFGQDQKKKICDIYDEKRRTLEEGARVHLFVPILACNATRQVLQQHG